MAPVVIGKRHSIQCHDFHSLAAQLKVGVAIGRGIHDAPELTLTWIDGEPGPDMTVRCENSPGTLIWRSSTSSRRDFDLAKDALFALGVAVLDVLIPKDDYTLAHMAQFRIISVDPFNDDGAGHAIEILPSALSVRVCVIPVQPRR